MALNRVQAARLLSDKEMRLFESSLADRAAALSDKELASAVRQLRSQRDKYQDLFRRQRVGTRDRTGSKGGPRGVSNERTSQKADAFAEALLRLEKQQGRREAARARSEAPSAKPAGRSAKAPRRGPSTSAGAAGSRPAPPSIPKQKRFQDMGSARPLAHVSSRGRRNQAKRDSR